MDPSKWQEMLWTVGFLSITYLPLQGLAIWKCRGIARFAAALPLLVMIPMFFGALQSASYANGSLFGMFFVCPFLPVMIYLSVISLIGSQIPKVCPHCGHRRRIKSFQLTGSTTCESCGSNLLKAAPT